MPLTTAGYLAKIESLARHLFATDGEMSRDRTEFRHFDDMPPGLQEWWRDRAIRRSAEMPDTKPEAGTS